MRELVEAGLPSTLEREAEIFVLDTGQVEHYWPQISECLDADPSLWDTWYSKEGLLRRAQAGEIQVWVICPEGGAIQTVFFSQVLSGDVARHLHIFWIWGEGALQSLKWAALAVEDAAVQTGCSEVFITGRKGWERSLRPFGAKFSMCLLSFPVQKRTKQ